MSRLFNLFNRGTAAAISVANTVLNTASQVVSSVTRIVTNVANRVLSTAIQPFIPAVEYDDPDTLIIDGELVENLNALPGLRAIGHGKNFHYTGTFPANQLLGNIDTVIPNRFGIQPYPIGIRVRSTLIPNAPFVWNIIRNRGDLMDFFNALTEGVLIGYGDEQLEIDNAMEIIDSQIYPNYDSGGCSNTFNDTMNVFVGQNKLTFSSPNCQENCFFAAYKYLITNSNVLNKNKIAKINETFKITGWMPIESARSICDQFGHGVKVYQLDELPSILEKPYLLFHNYHYWFLSNINGATLPKIPYTSIPKTLNPLFSLVHLDEKKPNIHKEKPTKPKKPISVIFYDIETRLDYENPFVYIDKGVERHGHKLKAKLIEFEYCDDIATNEWTLVKYYGNDCIEKFLTFLRESDTKYKIYAHNGSRFDHFFCYSEMEDKENIPITLSGSSFHKIRYHKHSFHDTCKVLTQSLDALCHDYLPKDDWKKKSYEIGGKNYTSYELCEMTDEILESNPDLMDAYLDYCARDVRSLRLIYLKFREVLKEVTNLELFDFQTIGTIALDYLKPCDNKNGKNPSAREEVFKFIDGCVEKNKFIRSGIRGGISYSHANKICKPYTTKESITGIDINSQYPASAERIIVPIGESRWIYNYNEIFDNDTLKQKTFGYIELKDLTWNTPGIKIIPDNSGPSLRWYYPPDNLTLTTNVVIPTELYNYMKKHNMVKSFTFVKGLISNRATTGKSLFGRKLVKLYQIKLEQDELKNNKDPSYNPSLRSTVKTILNSFYGKNVEDYSKHLKIVFCDDGEKTIGNVRYTEEPSNKINHYVTIGVNILAYSKMMMFNYMRFLPVGTTIFQIETDGFYFPTKFLASFTKNIEANKWLDPMYSFGVHLGGIKNEGSTIEGQPSITIGKKLYFLNKYDSYESGNEVFDLDSEAKFIDRKQQCMKMSSIPLYYYDSGKYRHLIKPTHYFDMAKTDQNGNFNKVSFTWNKLSRTISECIAVKNTTVTKIRGFVFE